MSLLFSTTQDEALLAMAIQEARQAEGLTYFGRTALQKIMYFLKALGMPINYRFDIYRYGPFCQHILNDTNTLIADEVIVNQSRQGHYFDYAPGPNIDELLDKHPELRSHREMVSRVVSLLAPMNLEKLELLSTLHFAFAMEKATAKSGPLRDRVLRRLQEFKGDKFSADEVANGYDALVRAGLAAP